MNAPLTTPEVDTVQVWDRTIFGVVPPLAVELMMQLVSRPLNAVPWTVILVPRGPSDGVTTTVATITVVMVKVAEAVSPNDPLTVTV